MPVCTLNRDYTLRSTKGHIINFKKGVPIHVPPALVEEAMALGAESDTDLAEGLSSNEDKLPVEPTGEERKAMIFKAFAQLLVRNQRGDFTAQGVPHPKALKLVLGFPVDNRERDALWQERIDKANEGK